PDEEFQITELEFGPGSQDMPDADRRLLSQLNHHHTVTLAVNGFSDLTALSPHVDRLRLLRPLNAALIESLPRVWQMTTFQSSVPIPNEAFHAFKRLDYLNSINLGEQTITPAQWSALGALRIRSLSLVHCQWQPTAEVSAGPAAFQRLEQLVLHRSPLRAG